MYADAVPGQGGGRSREQDDDVVRDGGGAALLGLLRTGKQVELVTDAIQSLDPAQSAKTITEFQSLGGTLTNNNKFY